MSACPAPSPPPMHPREPAAAILSTCAGREISSCCSRLFQADHRATSRAGSANAKLVITLQIDTVFAERSAGRLSSSHIRTAPRDPRSRQVRRVITAIVFCVAPNARKPTELDNFDPSKLSRRARDRPRPHAACCCPARVCRCHPREWVPERLRAVEDGGGPQVRERLRMCDTVR